MIIPPHRVKSIKKHFFEFSFNENDEEVEPDFNKFIYLSSTEQYYLASIYNWDDGVKVLQWIIDSDKCDKGTAIRIFWMAEPDYYFDYNSETIDKYEKEVCFCCTKFLEEKYNGDSWAAWKFSSCCAYLHVFFFCSWKNGFG